MRITRNDQGNVNPIVVVLLAILALLSLPGVIYAQASLETLRPFHRGPRNPAATVIEASDGFLYGTTVAGGVHGGGTLFRVNPDGTGYALLHEFDCYDYTDGCNPATGLIEGSDGVLYGTTQDGGGLFNGAVFRINKDGTGFALVHSFTLCRSTTISCLPGAVIEGSDGVLYGTSQTGGAFRDGEVYRVNRDGSGYTVLHAFRRGVTTDGHTPSGRLTEGRDGRLYGTTRFGGLFDDGILFAVNWDGTGYTVLHDFECPASGNYVSCRANPELIEASDGAIYGTTSVGMRQGTAGTLFRIDLDGTGFAVVHEFGGVGYDPQSAFGPQAGVIEASDGSLYGTTKTGGVYGDGTLYRINKDGTGFTVLHPFECGDSSTDGCLPSFGVIETSDGALYGMGTARSPLSLDSGLIFSLEKDGSGYRLVHAFRCGGPGCVAEAPLVEASDGALYGTMNGGGAVGAGVVFGIDKDGSGFSILHDFECSAANGCLPLGAGLIEASDGMLYGTTSRGGAFETGTLFALNKDGSGFSDLHSFDCGVGPATCGTAERLLEASDGTLYGTMREGGAGGDGTVFRIEKDGTGFTELYSLTCAADGCNPQGGLIEASDGALYGVNRSNGPLGGGTLFRINRDGSGYTVVHSFQNAVTNGGGPVGGLVEASDGVLYGATIVGGASFKGTVYRIDRDGTGFALLHSLDCGSDGCQPRGRIIEGSDGALYGTTSVGVGAASKGSVFRLQKDGSGFTLLHPFVFPCTGDNGCFPYAGVIEGSDGAFYGTTREGGGGAGILYRLTLNIASAPPTLVITTPEPGAVVPEGQVWVEGTASDDVEVVGVTVNGIDAVLTYTGNPNDPNEVAFSVPVILGVGDHTIEVIATDDEGNTDSALVDVHAVPVDSAAPQVSNVMADPNPAEVGTAVTLTADIDDSATGDSNLIAASYTIDDGPPVAMAASDGAFDSNLEMVVADLPGFATSGIYEICVTAEDEAGNVSLPVCTLLAVYDPGAGFVTGGGWFDSLPGAYRPDLSAAGRGNFGFVAKYKKGSSIPTGSTEFQVHDAGLNFHSSAYEWLVITGDDTAQYKGVGTVNGLAAPNGTLYRFMVWVADGAPDTFRMRIWWVDTGQEIDLYDSETASLGGGSIVIH